MPVEVRFFKAGQLSAEPERMPVPAEASSLRLLERAVRAQLRLPDDMTLLWADCWMPDGRPVQMDRHTEFDDSNLVEMVFAELTDDQAKYWKSKFRHKSSSDKMNKIKES